MNIRKLLTYICVIFVVCGLASCQNNGHIGWLFGVWRVSDYISGGVKQESQLINTTTFAFQNNIVNIVAFEDKEHTSVEAYGTWIHDGDNFTLDFTNYDDNNAPGTAYYAAPAWLGMTSDLPMRMQISDQKKDSFTLTWVDGEGVTKIYKLKKTW